MALFKIRKGGDELAAASAPAETIEALRRRARHRLIGATVLVLVGITAFPLLFDTQPRPVSVDIPIEIPDRQKAGPLAPPTPAAAASGKVTPAAPAVTAAPAPVAPAPPPAAPVAPAAPAASEPAPAPAASAAPAATPQPRASEPKAASRPDSAPKAEARPAAPARDDGAKARALLEGQPAPDAAAGRFVVQVGAFADADKAREVRMRVERAGLKTYTHVAETKDGRRIRVRVGPYPSRAEADKAAQKIKGLDLPAAILTL